MKKNTFFLIAGVFILGSIGGVLLCKKLNNKKCACIQQAPSARDTHVQSVQDVNAHSRLMISPLSLVPLTMCEALLKATQAVGTVHDDLGPANEAQEAFLDKQYLPYVAKNMRERFTSAELSSYASHDYKELNNVLEQKGFSIRFPQFDPLQLGILAIQDIIVKWLKEGEKTVITADGKEYPGVILKNARFFADAQRSVIIVMLETQSDDTVYLVTKRNGSLFDKEPTTAMIADALDHYHRAVSNGEYTNADDTFEAVHFPMILYQVQPDVSWLQKMRIGNASIAQAMQEIIFSMNEQGARAKVATGLIVAMAMRNDYHKEPLIIDTPFLVWIERSGVALPIFGGYMTKNYWKNPGAL